MFERLCPEYMALGMTYQDFWYGDPEIAKMVRRSYRLQRDVKDYWAWRQGAYVYEAILDAAPILRAFSKAKKPGDYPKKPYGFGDDEKRTEQENENKKSAGKVFMETFAAAWNKQFEEKEAVTNGGEHEARRR